MAAVLLRLAGLDALERDAEPEPPDGELGEVEGELGLAKGTPLSVRMTLGNPNCLKTASNTRNA
jgi:hypothetical protein